MSQEEDCTSFIKFFYVISILGALGFSIALCVHTFQCVTTSLIETDKGSASCVYVVTEGIVLGIFIVEICAVCAICGCMLYRNDGNGSKQILHSDSKTPLFFFLDYSSDSEVSV